VNEDTRPTEGTYERWGDYTGIQRRFNATSQIWVSGYWGFANNKAGTWMAELGGPKDGPEGLTKFSVTKPMALFPNPSSTMVNVEFDMPQTGRAVVELKDMSGKVVA